MICSRAQYRAITRDFASADADVDEALARAQSRCEELTERLWEKAERTETLEVRTGGYVYPKAYPVESVSVPDNAVVSDGQTGIYVGISAGLAWDSVTGAPAVRTTSVTSVGGYEDDEMPAEIVEAVAELAQYKLNPPTGIGIPAGATSIGGAGQSVAGRRLGGAGALPPTVKDSFFRWRHVAARMFG